MKKKLNTILSLILVIIFTLSMITACSKKPKIDKEILNATIQSFLDGEPNWEHIYVSQYLTINDVKEFYNECEAMLG